MSDASPSADTRPRTSDASPEPLGRFALLLFGRLGPVVATPSASIREGLGASVPLLKFCALLLHEHLLLPNLASGGVDVFVHSWNPELAGTIDGLFARALRGSRHEPVVPSLARSASQALAIGRAAALALAHEAAAQRRGGDGYELALALRTDAALLEPLLLRTLAPAHLWFSRQCCMDPASSEAHEQAVQRQCGHGVAFANGRKKRLVAHCRLEHAGLRRVPGRAPSARSRTTRARPPQRSLRVRSIEAFA